MSDRELTVQEIIEDLQAVEQEIRAYERKYRLASAVFYELYRQGKLDNGGYELTEDLGMWAGAYEIKLDREQRFLELSREYISFLKTKSDKGELELILRGEVVGI
jgi:hypothetical protein